MKVDLHRWRQQLKGFFYGLGTLGRSSVGFVVSSWLLYFYLPPDAEPLVPVALYGTAVLGGRLVGAVATPYLGHLSDRSKSRLGRRLPFMFIAAILILVTFVLFWSPPTQGASLTNWVYLLLVSILYRVAVGLYQVPGQALLPELAQDDQERVRLSTWESVFLLLGIMWGGAAGIFIEKSGFRPMSLIYLGIAGAAFFVPFFFLRERNPETKASQIRFWNSLRLTLQNKTFLHFALVWVLYLVATNFVQTAAPYIVTEVCLLNTAGTTYFFYLPGTIASLICYPLIGKAAQRWGKDRVYAGSLLASALIYPATMLIGRWIPLPMKVQCSSWAVLQSISIAGLVVLTNAFVAEITDRDDSHREGMYFASMKVVDQVFLGIASFLLPLVLSLGRSHAQGAIGVKLTGVIAGGLMLLGFFVFWNYLFSNSNTS